MVLLLDALALTAQPQGMQDVRPLPLDAVVSAVATLFGLTRAQSTQVRRVAERGLPLERLTELALALHVAGPQASLEVPSTARDWMHEHGVRRAARRLSRRQDAEGRPLQGYVRPRAHPCRPRLPVVRRARRGRRRARTARPTRAGPQEGPSPGASAQAAGDAYAALAEVSSALAGSLRLAGNDGTNDDKHDEVERQPAAPEQPGAGHRKKDKLRDEELREIVDVFRILRRWRDEERSEQDGARDER